MARLPIKEFFWHRVLLAVLACVAVSLAPQLVSADEIVKLKAELTGGSEVPPKDSGATGHADVTYDKTTHKLTWTVVYSGFVTMVTMAHFHGPAPTTGIAPIQIWIASGAQMKSPLQGSATLTDDQAIQLLDGRWYVNIHTSAHVAGEIRGQVAIVP
jgi:hypothetical protein